MTKRHKQPKEPDYPPIPTLFGGDLVLEDCDNPMVFNFNIVKNSNEFVKWSEHKIIERGDRGKRVYLTIDSVKKIRQIVDDISYMLFSCSHIHKDGDYLKQMNDVQDLVKICDILLKFKFDPEINCPTSTYTMAVPMCGRLSMSYCFTLIVALQKSCLGLPFDKEGLKEVHFNLVEVDSF